MKLELLILGITAAFIANIYYDGNLFKKFLKWKKYYKMGFYAFLGFSIYLLLKKDPSQGKNLLQSANHLIKVMPVDKDSKEFFSPLLQFSKLTCKINKFLNNKFGWFFITFQNKNKAIIFI